MRRVTFRWQLCISIQRPGIHQWSASGNHRILSTLVMGVGLGFFYYFNPTWVEDTKGERGRTQLLRENRVKQGWFRGFSFSGVTRKNHRSTQHDSISFHSTSQNWQREAFKACESLHINNTYFPFYQQLPRASPTATTPRPVDSTPLRFS